MLVTRFTYGYLYFFQDVQVEEKKITVYLNWTVRRCNCFIKKGDQLYWRPRSDNSVKPKEPACKFLVTPAASFEISAIWREPGRFPIRRGFGIDFPSAPPPRQLTYDAARSNHKSLLLPPKRASWIPLHIQPCPDGIMVSPCFENKVAFYILPWEICSAALTS